MNKPLRPGQEFLRNGKRQFIGQTRLAFGKLELVSDDGDLVLLSPDELRREISEGDIQLLVPDGTGVLVPVPPGWRADEREAAKKERRRREQILSFVDSEQERGVSLKKIISEIGSFCTTNNLGAPPCERTLRNWRQLAKGHEYMLSPAWERCGNRQQGPDEILLASIVEVLNTSLDSDRFTLSETWRTVDALYEEKWLAAHPNLQMRRHSVHKLRNFLRAMPWNELQKLQLDGRTARSLTRSAVHRNSSDVMWDVVEMDATVLDIFVADRDGNNIGRPVLYVAIDVATGYVVGLYLTISKPSTLPFVECLRFMFFPKPDGFDGEYGIKNRIEMFGKPVLLKVDNGSEFIGKAATELVLHLFGDTARCKPYRPEDKPHVERFNGTLRSYILTLDGATTSSNTKKMRVQPKNEVLFTLEQLRGKIYRFVYDRYALSTNELRSLKAGRACAPMDIVALMKKHYMEPVPVSREEFELSLCFKRETRNLGHDGILFDGWNYHSDDLKRVYERHGQRKYEFQYSELDATTIHVISPDGELVTAFEKNLEGINVDRRTASELRTQIARDAKELNRRAFAHVLAAFREQQASTKSTRSRAKAARVDALLTAAEEHVRPTMPRKAPTSESGAPLVLPIAVSVPTKSQPRGRKIGGMQ